jgi:RecA-family ATPase|nr:MAG TPA_asm: Regulatory protein repA [Caudoviricetes sp.]
MNDITTLLNYIDPGSCTYSEWAAVGMALKEEGFSCSDWDSWSSKDISRYHKGECEKKWNSFNGSAAPVTGGTIFQMAVDRGYTPETGHELDWDSPIDSDGVVVNKNWIEGVEIQEPKKWHPAKELKLYLETLFEAGENVGIVTHSWKNEKGKYVPKDKGLYTKTAGQLIEELEKCKDDIGSVVGDYDKDGGAWIRFNPLDGKGVRNDNVTEYRYALVESDDMELEKQNAILREMALPIAVLMYSGGKSLHAIVKVDAADYNEYRKRVDYLYSICEKNGMSIDSQNRNPSRLSRMPGCTRGEHKQFIVDTNIGMSSWTEWHEWIESVNDNLPEFEELSDEWEDMPELAPELIEGVLRQGHKMLMAGPSKAGKSFALIELCIAIAEGKQWINWKCAKGRVLYVNLELDRASCLHRFRDVYKTLNIRPENLQNIDIWNLRGKAIPMDKLAPKLIRRAQKKDYIAIIIDPIYKIITGDENSADQMAAFCNQFDIVCTELKSAVIYCHHHSKGSQGQKKAIDRSSGSGVFARDPDAVLDYIELEKNDDLIAQQVNKAICRTCRIYMDSHNAWTKDMLDPDSMENAKVFVEYCKNTLDRWQMAMLQSQIDDEVAATKSMSAWRIEGTLREFAAFDPVDCWFRYPIHYMDASGVLKDSQAENAMTKVFEERKKAAERAKVEQKEGFDIAFEGLEEDGKALLSDIAEQIGVSQNTIGAWLGNSKRGRKNFKKEYETFTGDNNKRYVRRKIKDSEKKSTTD